MNFSKFSFLYKLCLISIFNFLFNELNAQSDSISGIILDDFGVEIPFVRVIGIDSLDQLIQGDISDFSGKFNISKSHIKRIIFVSECSKDTFNINHKSDYYRIKSCNTLSMTTRSTCPHFSANCNIYHIIYVYPSHDVITHQSPLPYRVFFKSINVNEPKYTWKCVTHDIEY